MEPKLRICIVTDAYLPGIGGIENHTVNLSAELARRGHEVTVVTHQVPENAPRLAHQVRSPVPVRRLPGVIFVYRDHDIAFSPTMFVYFERLLRSRRFDIVHGQSEGSMLVWGALAQARLHRIPTVLTRHSVLSVKPRLAWPLVKWPTAVLLGLCSGVIAVSTACAGERLGFRGPVRVIPNGVDVDAYRPEDASRRAATRAGLGLADDDVAIGFVGRLHSSKGVGVLLRAFERIRSPKLRLILAGPGPLRRDVERSPGFSAGAIRLLPALAFDRVPALLNAMDVFAFPSDREAFGIALLEAMACGLPSVAMGRWGVLDLAEANVTGFLAGSADEFEAGLRRLAQDPALRHQMGAAARRRAVERFAWSRVVGDTVSFYRELARS